MKVGIYIGTETPQAGGSPNFVRAVLQGLEGVETTHSFHVLHSGFEDVPSLRRIPVSRVAQRKLQPMRILANRFRSRARRNELWERAVQDELNALGLHLIWFLTPATVPTTLPYVFTVWDLAHRVEPAFPEVRAQGWSWDAREALYRKWLPPATYVVIGATAGGDDITRCYGVSPRRIRVLPLIAPAHDGGASASVRGVKPPYLFYPAQFWPHKNHAGLLLAFQRVREVHGVEMQLVLTGSDKGNLAHVRAMAADLGIDQHVVFAGFVDDAQLTSLYRNAFALVFPSFFGPDNLPPLEAMQVGCPVIAADVPGAEEQVGDSGLLVDPRSVDSIAAAIMRLHSEPELRECLITRGHERVKRWGPREYASGIVRIVDEFETERRCWSYSSEYVHT